MVERIIAWILARGTNKLRIVWLNSIMPHLNYFLLKGFGVHVGQNCEISALPTYRIGRKARINIGDNFRLSGSTLINPLNNRRTVIAVSDNAVLKIGNSVGMSSPTLYIQDSLVIGNHVNLGGGYGRARLRLPFFKLS